ncbi:MAG: zinc ribbon domain-containing protein [Pelagibacterales bacterium]|nr:zinc ribbon domain-containing protein [Pelagibacterales bacterium]
MPFYTYKCEKCNTNKEVLVKDKDEVISCPKCASILKRLITKTSFVLKGRGWEKDGYA